MKKIFTKIIICLVGAVLIVGCGKKDLKKELAGEWYSSGRTSATFTLYDDGTCIIAGEYGTGSWDVVNENQLKLTNFYGESEVAEIVSITDGKLELSSDGDISAFYNQPQN